MNDESSSGFAISRLTGLPGPIKSSAMVDVSAILGDRFS
jgi:hypothetical protein